MRYRWVKRPWHDAVGGLLLAGCGITVLILTMVL